MKSVDVAIIGAGLAGIVAAQDLLDAGKTVALIDKKPRTDIGGMARWSFGGIFIVDSPQQRRTGIHDSEELAYQDWCRYGELRDGPYDALQKRWAAYTISRTHQDILEYLKARKVGFFPIVHWVERGLHIKGNSVPRFHMVWGTGDRLTRQCVQKLLEHPKRQNLNLYFEHDIHALEEQNRRVIGCSGADHQGKAFNVRADAVIIASGGVAGNLPKVRAQWPEHWGQPPEHLLTGTHPQADGAMQDSAASIGASVIHRDRMWSYAAGVTHPNPRYEHHGLSLVPCKSALWMDAHGRRFQPTPLVTGYDTRFLVKTVAQQKHAWSWQILNSAIAKKEFAISGAESNPAIRDRKFFAFLRTTLFGNQRLVDTMLRDCPDFVVANTLPELAAKMAEHNFGQSIDTEGLLKDVRRYDAEIARGSVFFNDQQLQLIEHARKYRGDKVRTSAFAPIENPNAKPYIAIRSRIIARKTLGGLQTDLSCQVLDTDGKPKPGLFAIGEAAGFGGGNVHGQRALEGTFLGGCLVTARTAARVLST